MFYTYVLKSEKDGKLYTGCMDNLKGRFEAHVRGRVPSTKNRRPLELVYFKAGHDGKDARHREKYL